MTVKERKIRNMWSWVAIVIAILLMAVNSISSYLTTVELQFERKQRELLTTRVTAQEEAQAELKEFAMANRATLDRMISMLKQSFDERSAELDQRFNDLEAKLDLIVPNQENETEPEIEE